MWNKDRSSPRSDNIRKRLSKSTHTAGLGTDRRKRKRNTRIMEHTPPPVMTRYSMTGTPYVRERNSKRLRRRYDIALNAQGAEIRLPSLPMLRLDWRVLSLILIIVLGFGIYQAWNLPLFKVSDVQIQGLKRISSMEVTNTMGLAGKTVFSVNPTDLEEMLRKSFPEFSTIQVAVELPNKVLVNVAERVPVLIWQQGDQLDLVDASGMAFEMRGDASGEGLLKVEADGTPSGLDAPLPEIMLTPEPETTTAAIPTLPSQLGAHPLLKPEMVKAIILVASQAPQGVPVLYSQVHGLGWKDNRGWAVYLGNTQDMEMKLQVYQAIQQRLLAQDIIPTLISVEYIHAPYYRME